MHTIFRSLRARGAKQSPVNNCPDYVHWIASLALAMTIAFNPSSTLAGATDLGEIEVTAPDLLPRQDSTATSTIMLPKQGEETTTTQIIEKSPGIHVKRLGNSDDSASISMRGAPANQLGIYYDGVPLSGSVGNAVDLSLVPAVNIDRIELYRGGSPARATESSPAGAIFLNTPGKPDKFGFKFSGLYGSFGTLRSNVQVTQPLKDIWYLASIEHAQSEGNFTFLDNNGTWSNTGDDTIAKRANNDFRSDSLLTKIGWNSETWKIEASNTYLNKKSGIPGLGSFQSRTASLAGDRNVTVAKLSNGPLGLTTFFDYLNSRFSDPNGEIGLGVQRNDDDTYRFGEEIFEETDLNEYNHMFASISHRAEYFSPHSDAVGAGSGETSSRNQVGALLEDTMTLSDSFSIAPSLRFMTLLNDLSSNDPSIQRAAASSNNRKDYQFSAKVGAKIMLLSELCAKVNFYRGFRNPTFAELFGDRGTLIGNPDLAPEEALNVDGGLLYDLEASGSIDKLRIEATYFRNDENNLIQFLQTSQFTAMPQNIASAVIQGVETSAQMEFANHFSGVVGYTFQDARDRGSSPTRGNRLPGRPKHELWAEPSVYGKWGKIFCEYNFMSGNFLDSQNLLEVTNRNLLGFGVVVIPKEMISLSFSAKNVLNDRTVDVIGFPLPGRSYWGGVTLSL